MDHRHRPQGHHGGGGGHPPHHRGGHHPPPPPHPSGRPPSHHQPPPHPGGSGGGGEGHHSHQQQHHHPHPHHGHHPGQQQQQQPHPEGVPQRWHSFKMLVDPQIHRGAAKMVRYDGSIVPGNPHHIAPVPQDPRKKLPSALWKRLEPMDLPVPRLKIDENYVGEPPKVEVTIENLNDNVDKQFLHQMVAKFGTYEEMHIYYHPTKRKHLGLARLVFEEVRSAKQCVANLHEKSVMGQRLNCYLDPSGASCKKMFADLTTEKKPEPPPPPPKADSDEERTEGGGGAGGDETPPSRGGNSRKSPESKWGSRRNEDPRESRDRGGKRSERRRSEHHNHDSRSRSGPDDHDDFWREGPMQSSRGHRVPPPPPSHWERADRSRKEDSTRSYDPYPQAKSHQHHRHQQPEPHPGDDQPSLPPMPPVPPPPPPQISGGGQGSQPNSGAYQHSAGFDPQYSEPDYWLQQAQHYADQAAGLRASFEGGPQAESMDDADGASAKPKDEKEEGEESGSDDGNDHKVDLDTRLKMLMKGPQSSVPAFLLQELHNSETEEEEIKEEAAPAAVSADGQSVFPLHADERPLSRPPSPFLSAAHYLESHKEWLEERRKESEALGGKGNKRVNGGGQRRPNSACSDKMSLSSLSSGENNILEQGPDASAYPPPPPHYGYYPGMVPPHGYPGGELVPGQTMYDMYPPGAYGEYDPNAVAMYYEQTGQYPPGWGEMEQTDYQTAGKHAIKALIDECVDVLIQDLRKTLCKDINKKIGETFAFYLYEQWWAENEEKYKASQRKKLESKKTSSAVSATPTPSKAAKTSAADGPVHITASGSSKVIEGPSSSSAAGASTSSAAAEKAPKSNVPLSTLDVSSFFDKQREKMESGGGKGAISSAFGQGGSLGFGFRGTIPKLPSFKMKKSSAKKKGDGRKSDGESSDEDGRRHGSSSSSNKRASEKRRDQERRREQRLREKDRWRRDDDHDSSRRSRDGRESTKTKVQESKDDSRKAAATAKSSKDATPSTSAAAAADKNKAGKTLQSIYSQIYSDSDSDEGAKIKSSDFASSGSDEPVAPKGGKKKSLTKTKSQKRAARSESSGDSSGDESSSVHSTSSAASEVSFKSLASSRATSSASSSLSGSSSSASATSSSSESEGERQEKKPPAAAPKKAATAKVKDKPTVAKVTKDSSEDMEVDVEREEEDDDDKPLRGKKPPAPLPASKTASDTETSDEGEKSIKTELPPPKEPPAKKPMPQRRPSATPQPKTPTSSQPPETKIPDESPPHIIDHCYARPSSEEKRFHSQFANDHGYTRPRTPPGTGTATPDKKRAESVVTTPVAAAVEKPPPGSRTKGGRKASAKAQQQIERIASAEVAKYKARSEQAQFEINYKFLTQGLDLEDLSYLKRSYQMMLNQSSQDKNLYWLNDTHWVDHTITDLPSPPKTKRRRRDDFSRPHLTGSCRTEGYYKMDPREKARTKYHLHRGDTNALTQASLAKLTKAQNLSREARNSQRRQLTVLGDEAQNSDLLKFNQLKFRRKQMMFGKSSIHDWGLFSLEDIGPDEMVIEYVGHSVRTVLSDVRENKYEKQGIGSSYLFRVDLDYVVDATKCGNLARFINHSCDPNCYAKVISVDGEKKIVIYSKQPIAVGEEITYDYKFPIEDEKIVCLCAAKNCRKYLN